MKIAIVGTSKLLYPEENERVKINIDHIINSYPREDTIIISGGAWGIDTMAIHRSHQLSYNTQVFYPLENTWPEYRKRNIQIAEQCDELYCITIPIRKQPCYHHETWKPHEKTAGCWTMNEAMKLGKKTWLIVV